MVQLPWGLQKDVHSTVVGSRVLKIFIRSSISSLTFYVFLCQLQKMKSWSLWVWYAHCSFSSINFSFMYFVVLLWTTYTKEPDSRPNNNMSSSCPTTGNDKALSCRPQRKKPSFPCQDLYTVSASVFWSETTVKDSGPPGTAVLTCPSSFLAQHFPLNASLLKV